jgi:predicted nuclease of predicted toxin-antitoxin system
MKLLFDQNLSPKLAGLFAKSFEESKHLQDIKLDSASDTVVWEFAKTEGFSIVTKDNDFIPFLFISQCFCRVPDCCPD